MLPMSSPTRDRFEPPPTPHLSLLVLLGLLGLIVGAACAQGMQSRIEAARVESSQVSPSAAQGSESKGVAVETPEPTHARGRFALLVGESRYTEGWSPLPGVRDDLDNMETALKALDFQVIRVEDKTRAQLLQVLEDFRALAGGSPDNTLVLYFSGHGHSLQRESGTSSQDEEATFVPVDAPSPETQPGTFYMKALELGAIAHYSTQLRARQVLIVLDSCFSGAALSQHVRGSGAYREPTIDAGRAPVRLFMTAGQAQKKVPGKSVFTPALRRALEGKANTNGDQWLTGGELCSYVQREITRINQLERPRDPVPQPSCGALQDPRYAQGQFYLEAGTQNPPTPIPGEAGSELPGKDKGSCLQARPLRWIRLETGSFPIGRADGYPTQQPTFTATLPAFEVLESEVTVAQYELCVQEGRCAEPVMLQSRPECHWRKSGKCNHPMNCITHSEAKQYAEFLGGDLPTELQWERMARGVEGRLYPWGNDAPTCQKSLYGQIEYCAGTGMLPVCTADGRTEEGLCDLAGNASEWVRDDWDTSAYQELKSRENGHPNLNGIQRGSSTASVRGGSFLDGPLVIRGDSRGSRDKSSRYQGSGFRVVREIR